jgi:hypothetical protein
LHCVTRHLKIDRINKATIFSMVETGMKGGDLIKQTHQRVAVTGLV